MKPFIKELADENTEFQSIIKELINNETVQNMIKYKCSIKIKNGSELCER